MSPVRRGRHREEWWRLWPRISRPDYGAAVLRLAGLRTPLRPTIIEKPKELSSVRVGIYCYRLYSKLRLRKSSVRFTYTFVYIENIHLWIAKTGPFH